MNIDVVVSKLIYFPRSNVLKYDNTLRSVFNFWYLPNRNKTSICAIEVIEIQHRDDKWSLIKYSLIKYIGLVNISIFNMIVYVSFLTREL